MVKKNSRLLLIVFAVFTKQALFSVPAKQALNDFGFNECTMFGEDGIIQKIFEIIGTTSKLCLEVGADDGIVCANVARLWRNLGWRAILIEGDQEKFKKLENNTRGYNCILVKSYIEPEERLGPTIDSIVHNLNITEQLDLLSLDIDGNDYYVFESLKLHPRVMIVEFNPSIPYYRDVYQQYTNHSWEIGCSVASLIRIGKQKGYDLVALTDVNAFFVDHMYIDKFATYETAVEKIFKTDYLKNIVLSYSGDSIVVGKINHLSDGFFKVGYQREMVCKNCYTLRINEIDLNDSDLNKNFPGFPKNKPSR